MGLSQNILLDTVVLDFDELGVNEGVSVGNIRNVVQDTFGYLWLGTAQGLNRYDGYNIKEYIPIQGDSFSAPEFYSRPLLVDNFNNLWIAKQDEGIYIFDTRYERFFPLNLNLVALHRIDDDNNLWLSLEGDLTLYLIDVENINPQENNLSEFDLKGKEIPVTSFFSGFNHAPTYNHILTEENQLCWISDNNIICYQLDYSSQTAQWISEISLNQTNPKTIIKGGEKLYYDSDEDLMLIFYDNAYGKVNMHDGTVSILGIFPKNYHNIRPGPIDNRHRLWMMVSNLGMAYLDLKTNTLTDIRMLKKKDVNMGIIRPASRIIEDNEGNIWILVTAYGSFKYSPDRELFKYYGEDKLGPSMGEMFINKDGHLSFLGSGIKVLNPKTKKDRILFDVYSVKDEKARSGHTGFHVDHRGDFWFRIRYVGRPDMMYHISSKGRLIKEYYINDLNKYNATRGFYIYHESDSIWRMSDYMDKEGKHKWQILKSDTSYSKEPRIIPIETENHMDQFKNIMASNDTYTWMAFNIGGVLQYNRINNTSKQLFGSDSNNRISSELLLSMMIDPRCPDSLLWMGSRNGLFKYDLKQEKLTKYNTSNSELPDNVIYGILADKRNNFWMSTNRGLVLLNPEDMSTRIFTTKDGLPHNEFNTNSYAMSPDGTMFFGGVAGLVYFNPEDFYNQRNISPIIIHGLRLDNHKVEYSRRNDSNYRNFSLNEPLIYLDEIEIPYGYRMVTFEFAVMDLTRPLGNKFRYRLNNFNDIWVDLGDNNEVTFTNLAPGRYELQVQGSNHHGNWNEKGDTMLIHILTPWWKSLWFKGLVIFSLASFLNFLYRFRMNQTQRLHDLRNQISQDLHDEIGSTLSSIALFGAVAQAKLSEEDEVLNNMLDKINKSTINVTESMNDIVWAIKSENDSLKNIVNRMRAYTAEITEASDWSINFDVEENLLPIELGMIQRRNMYLIFKEAVTNAVKYSQGNKIEVKLFRQAKILHMSIRDNGIGFDIDHANGKKSLSGNGLQNMKRRADEVNGKLSIVSSKATGTQIVLKFEL